MQTTQVEQPRGRGASWVNGGMDAERILQRRAPLLLGAVTAVRAEGDPGRGHENEKERNRAENVRPDRPA